MVLKALDLKPNDGYITDSLGWIYFQKGHYKKAVKFLRKAIKLAPDDPVISDHLGDAYMKLDQYKDALDAYRKAVTNAQDRDRDLVIKIKEKIKAVQDLIHD